MGLKDLKKMQVGIESPRGTGATPTTKLLGEFTLKLEQEQEYPSMDDFSLAEFDRSYKVAEQAKITRKGVISYEQILYYLSSFAG